MKRLLIVTIPLLLLAGCFSLPRETLEIVRYSFHPAELAGPEGQEFDGALLILPFSTASEQHGDRIGYKEGDHEMETYYYHRWIAPPEQLMADLLNEDMVHAGLFNDGVFMMTTGITPTHELHGRMVKLYADNRKNQQAAVVEIMLTVFRIQQPTYDKQLILQKTYKYHIDRENGRVESFVPAVTEAMTSWLVDVRTDMATLLAEDQNG
ncbi:membrane integrity-associated transporter subunit PqiC [bacterium]|nr:membrane integrity-associated transporter subunit PqiC [bacterium]